MSASPFIQTIDFQRGKPFLVNSTTAGSADIIHKMTSTTDMDACYLWAHNGDGGSATIYLVLNPDDSAVPVAAETLQFSFDGYESAWLINGLRFRKSLSGSNTYTIGAYAQSGDQDKVRICFYANRQAQDSVTA